MRIIYLAGGAINVVNNGEVSRLIVNTTDFKYNTGPTLGGGAVYFASTATGSSLSLREVYFEGNTGVSSASSDIYADLTDITCVTDAGSTQYVSGSTTSVCTTTTTQPTMVRSERENCMKVE